MSDAGSIIIKGGVKPWPHELRTAEALAAHGLTVMFLARKEGERQSSADVIIDGVEWEIKSPISDKLSNVQKTLRKAVHQSSCIIYDSQRVKNLTDQQIERELRKQAKAFRSIKHVLFVTKKRCLIDIK